MRWVFFALLIINVLYLAAKLILDVAPVPAAKVPYVPASGGERLVLLAERRAGATDPQADQQAAPVRKCVMAGPWAEAGPAREALAQAPASWGGTVKTVNVVRDRLHWVYLPPAEDRDSALRLLRELQNREVDSFLVGEGDDRNAISLGYFSRADSARGLMVKMRNEGYPAQIRETSRTLSEFWLSFPAGEQKELLNEAARQKLASLGAKEVREAACN